MPDQKVRWRRKAARYISTLVYLDEPQVVLLDHGNDAKIVGVAIDKDGYDCPFLGAEILNSQWIRYLRQFVDLRYLFLAPKWKKLYIFDLMKQDKDGYVTLKIAGEDVVKNEEFLPSHGFFAREHTELVPISGRNNVVCRRFLIDGTWDPQDLSLFFGRINELYSFFLGIRKYVSGVVTESQKNAIVKIFSSNELDSGFSHVHFFGDLKGLISFDERLAMHGIQKQSPGFLDVEAIEAVIDEVDNVYLKFILNREIIKKKYN